MNDTYFSDVPPPSPEQIAKRAIILSVISCRGFTEKNTRYPEESEDLAKRSYLWIKELDLLSELTEWEKKIFKTPFGQLSEKDRINTTWLSEAVTVLAWSLKRYSLPPYDIECDSAEAAASLGFLENPNNTVLAQPEIRDIKEIHDFNEFIYNLHWRLRDFSIHHKPYNFKSLASKAWGKPILKYGLKLKNKDLVIKKKPIYKSSEEKWRTVLSITQERHRASNWTIGYASKEFYEVTTDT